MQKVLSAYVTTWRKIHAEMDGNDLKALGIPRGPIYRRLLRALRAARLDGSVTSRADEEALVKRLWEAQRAAVSQPSSE